MKRFILIAICLMILTCSTTVLAATTFSDVKDTKYQDSVEILIKLGLVNGYEDNTYKPYNVVTRAEMAKLMVVALGKEADAINAKDSASKFSDVKPSDWENGYVNMASYLGIIKGYPDGTFGPKDTVSYAEATAMVVRALGFDEAVSKSEDVWPLNYINQAKKLSLYESIGTVAASDGAKRGNVAILLWNMLRTGVSTVVGENTQGLVYGEGEPMMNVYMNDYTYLTDAVLSDADFEGKDVDATVKFVGDKTVTATMDAYEATEKFGLKFDLLYNNKTKKIELLQESLDNDTISAKVTKVTSSKIYVEKGNSKGYALPKSSHILLYGIDELEDAIKVNLVFKGSEVEYVSAFGPDKVYFALVLDDDVTVSKKDGIEVVNYKTSTSRKIALADEDDVPSVGDVILYYLNEDNQLVVLENVSIDDSKVITSASTKKISLDGKSYALGSSEEYVIASVGKKTLEALSISKIEDDEDTACLIEFGGVKYFVIYVGGTSEMEKEIAQELKTTRNNLNKYIKSGEAVEEKYYTQESYANLQKALSTAKDAYNKSNASLATVKSAYTTLKTKYEALVKIANLSSTRQKTEREIVANKIELRELVEGTTVANIIKNKSSYTEATYKAFNTAYTSANTILAKTNASLTDITNTKKNLDKAISELVKNTEDEDRNKAVTALSKALNDALAVGKKEEYTTESYENFKMIWDEVRKIDLSTATTNEINNGATKLNNAMKLLAKNVTVAMSELNDALLRAEALTDDEELYSSSSFEKLETAIKNARAEKENPKATNDSLSKVTKALNDAIKGLVKVDDELANLKKEANSRVKAIDTALKMPESTLAEKEAKIKALSKAINAEKSALATAKTNLENKITEAKAIKESEWSTYHTGSYSEMKAKLSEAEKALLIDKVTSEELIAAYKALNEALV